MLYYVLLCYVMLCMYVCMYGYIHTHIHIYVWIYCDIFIHMYSSICITIKHPQHISTASASPGSGPFEGRPAVAALRDLRQPACWPLTGCGKAMENMWKIHRQNRWRIVKHGTYMDIYIWIYIWEHMGKYGKHGNGQL